MHKYYVLSRDLNVVISALTPMDAALRAISTFPDRGLSTVILVNEHGFTDGTTQVQDIVFDTADLLSELGLE